MAHFVSTLLAVWLGVVLAGITLVFLGGAWLGYHISKAMEPSRQETRDAGDELRKWQAEQKKADAARKKIEKD